MVGEKVGAGEKGRKQNGVVVSGLRGGGKEWVDCTAHSLAPEDSVKGDCGAQWPSGGPQPGTRQAAGGEALAGGK